MNLPNKTMKISAVRNKPGEMGYTLTNKMQARKAEVARIYWTTSVPCQHDLVKNVNGVVCLNDYNVYIVVLLFRNESDNFWSVSDCLQFLPY